MISIITTEKLPIKMWLREDELEEIALNQAKNLANLPFAQKWIALMPDCHMGYGMPIGGVMATDDVIVPNAVGVDIGCGMCAVKTNLSLTNFENSNDITEFVKKVMGRVREEIPVGFNHHKENQEWDGFLSAPDIPVIQRELSSARKQLGTLGGGNHFIEIQYDEYGFIWFMIHSGSRNFGLKVAKEYHNIAMELCEKWFSNIPHKDLSFLPIDSKEGNNYYTAMKFSLQFAFANRNLMMERVISIFKNIAVLHDVDGDILNIHHNYAAFEHHFGENVLVHRKGATRVPMGNTGIIPGSMGAYSCIVEGLDNDESFKSCSHGAGRRMGRKEATRLLNLEEEQKKMEGIVHGLRTVDDLDEAPGAYKDIYTVMQNQKDLVKVVRKLKPLGVVKG